MPAKYHLWQGDNTEGEAILYKCKLFAQHRKCDSSVPCRQWNEKKEAIINGGGVGGGEVAGCLQSRHRVGRVLSFFSSGRNWDSPNPSPAADCALPLPPLVPGGGAHSLVHGRVPIPTRGHKLWYTVYTYMYFVTADFRQMTMTAISSYPH